MCNRRIRREMSDVLWFVGCLIMFGLYLMLR